MLIVLRQTYDDDDDKPKKIGLLPMSQPRESIFRTCITPCVCSGCWMLRFARGMRPQCSNPPPPFECMKTYRISFRIRRPERSKNHDQPNTRRHSHCNGLTSVSLPQLGLVEQLIHADWLVFFFLAFSEATIHLLILGMGVKNKQPGVIKSASLSRAM